MSKENILNEIITGYRNVIYQRYQYHDIKSKYGLPASIDEETVTSLREYFLNYIYPELAKRKELNDAFESLDSFIKHPEKLLRILVDSIKLIFQYGRHLPKILNAGLKAMKAFRAATKLEDKLVEGAINYQIEPPFDSSKINRLIGILSQKEIEQFIEGSRLLFETIHDKVLVSKIKEIIGYLITKMREKQKLYSLTEIRGLEIGLELLNEGDAIFNKLTKEDQHNLFHLVTKIETDALYDIFLKK